jgi:hypothetical protein
MLMGSDDRLSEFHFLTHPWGGVGVIFSKKKKVEKKT